MLTVVVIGVVGGVFFMRKGRRLDAAPMMLGGLLWIVLSVAIGAYLVMAP